MKKFLLLLPLVFSIIAVNAQYTITDENSNPVVDGSTINIELPNADEDYHMEWRMVSINSSEQSTFEVLSTTQVGASQNMYCIFGACQPPNTTSSTGNLDTEDKKRLDLYYKPRGEISPAVIEYKVSEVGNSSNSFTFTLSFTIATGIDEITNKKHVLVKGK